MAVRYRPRGVNLYPGRRACYVFANEITRARGIPPKTSYGTVAYTSRGYSWVVFDGNDYRSQVPIPVLCPEDAPVRRGLPDDWFHRTRWVDPVEEEQRQFERRMSTWPLNPDLVDRAIARYGPRARWRRRWAC